MGLHKSLRAMTNDATAGVDNIVSGYSAYSKGVKHNGTHICAVMPTQEKSVTITANGTTNVTPDSGKTLSKVGVTVNVPNPSTGTKEITENGTYDVTAFAEAMVNVPTGAEVVTGEITISNDTKTITLPALIGKSNAILFVHKDNLYNYCITAVNVIDGNGFISYYDINNGICRYNNVSFDTSTGEIGSPYYMYTF